LHPTCEVCGGNTHAATTRTFEPTSVEPAETEVVPVEPAVALDLHDIEGRMRGRLFQELDLLAYALEMEAAESIERGDDAAADRAQQTRLGIRLAQRLVGAVSSPEVDRRLDRWRTSYRAKFPA